VRKTRTQVLLNESGTAGNWGELDKIAAMEWMRRNAKSFGADPARAAPGVNIAF
jgi:carboxylesterase type B